MKSYNQFIKNRINEDYIFIDKNNLYKIEKYKLKPPFKLNDTVYIVKDGLNIHLDNIKFEEAEGTINYIKDNILKPLIVKELTYDDENKIWFVNIGEWVYAGSVKKNEPSYEPKGKIDRTL